jgi:hypothetical protein
MLVKPRLAKGWPSSLNHANTLNKWSEVDRHAKVQCRKGWPMLGKGWPKGWPKANPMLDKLNHANTLNKWSEVDRHAKVQCRKGWPMLGKGQPRLAKG